MCHKFWNDVNQALLVLFLGQKCCPASFFAFCNFAETLRQPGQWPMVIFIIHTIIRTSSSGNHNGCSHLMSQCQYKQVVFWMPFFLEILKCISLEVGGAISINIFSHHIYNISIIKRPEGRSLNNCTTFPSLCSAVIFIVQCSHYQEKLHHCHHDHHHYQRYPDAPVGQHC